MCTAMFWLFFKQRRWLLYTNVAIVFFVCILFLGLSPPEQFFGVKRWSEVIETPVTRTINTCTPKINIVFLKTHKCASSSVQNILLRYAHVKNLTVVLPVQPKTHYLSRLRPFRKEMIAGAPWENLGYNILCHHMIFNPAAVERIMPRDSLYISIIRNPVFLFESMYEYDQLQEFYKMDIEEYARATKNASLIKKIRIRANGMGRNPMLYDFGVHPGYFGNRRLVEDAIKKIESRFDFIMVAEHFDESIVLLRHILCWDLDDVISLTVNARMDSYKKNLSNEAIRNLQQWHWGDQMLYNYFLQKFEVTVDEFGRVRMKEEVEALRKRRQDWFENCIEEAVESKNLTAYKIWSSKVVGFKLKTNVSNETCEDLVKPEKFFTNEIRQHQIIRSFLSGTANMKYLSYYHMIDLKNLKGKELEIAKQIFSNHFKRKRQKLQKKIIRKV